MAEEADELDLGKLEEYFKKAEQADRKLFAEMKSNILMVSGKHWENTRKRLWNRMRDSTVDPQTKIRLTKNHLSVITSTYQNEILSMSPWVRPLPHTESALQDQKAAELAESVWEDARSRYKLNEKIKDWIADYIDIGEVCVKIIWDKCKGKQIGWEQSKDENGSPLYAHPVTGEPTTDQYQYHPETKEVLRDQTGQPIQNAPHQSDIPVMSGDFVFESLLPFNLLRCHKSESMSESPYLMTRKMMSVDEAKALCGGDQEKIDAITASSETTFKIFDAQNGEFTDSKDSVLLKEIFFRPCKEYPQGLYAAWTTETQVVDPMPLPFGIFPIVWQGFQKIQTTPRAHSIIRHLRPLQANINQLASMQVESQLTLGSPKLIIQGASKVEKGGELPGTRVIRVTGPSPTIMPGYQGADFLPILQAAVDEMYSIANLQAIKEDISGQMDPMALLFRSMKHKKKFSLYAESFGQFLIDLCSLYLKLAQKYLDDSTLIKKVGKREAINISEFKNIDEMDYTLKVEEIDGDIESMLGKSMQIQSILQYVGKDLPQETIAQVVCKMPFVNADAMFSDLTVDSRNADADILALDRGEQVPPRPYENHKYIIKRLTSRMKERDFDLLSPQIKQNYELKVQQHQQAETDEAAQLKAMESEFIPTGGGLIGCDIFQEAPNTRGGTKQVRLRVPQEAIMWLVGMLEKQGIAKADWQDMGQAPSAQMAQMFLHNQQNPQGPMPGTLNHQGAVQGQQPPMPGQGAPVNGSIDQFNARNFSSVNGAANQPVG